MKILSIISRDLEKGSTKFRLAQYVDFLAVKWVSIEFIKRSSISNDTLKKAAEADILFNQKCLLDLKRSKQLLAVSKRVVFDFDDAIYTRPGKPYHWFTQYKVNQRLSFWLRHSSLVIPANQYLKNYALKFSKKVKVLPMALDLELWKPQKINKNDFLTIGWAGAPVNLHLLERLEPILEKVLQASPQVRLAVFCGEKPKLKVPFQFVPFQPGMEPEFVQSLDIGLLPLSDEEFTRGKSPIKSLQYMACGVPVVGNVFGATNEILQPDRSISVNSMAEWIVALERLISSPELRRKMGISGRQFVEKNHDIKTVQFELWSILKELSGNTR